MNFEIELRFSGGYLRVLKPDDVHYGYVSGLNDPEVNRYLDGVRRVTQTEHSVVEFVQNDLMASNAVLFGIWLEGGEQHCGTIRLHSIENYHKTAYIGACLFQKEAWGKRLGSKSIDAVTRWAFDTLDLRWIEAAAYKQNLASQKAFLAAGYEWIYDISDKYLLNGIPTEVKVFASRNRYSEKYKTTFQNKHKAAQ